MSQKSMKKVNLNLSTMRQREENEQSWWSFLRVGPTNIDSFILSILQATTSRWHLQQEALSSNRQVLWVAVGEPSTMSVFFSQYIITDQLCINSWPFVLKKSCGCTFAVSRNSTG